jgi:hypothetical protein
MDHERQYMGMEPPNDDVDHHLERDTKYCLTCDTHFRAHPHVHEDACHESGEWAYVDGSYSTIERDPTEWMYE